MYHCTEPVPAEPDWGIAVRVSQEAEGVISAEPSSRGRGERAEAGQLASARHREGTVGGGGGGGGEGAITSAQGHRKEQGKEGDVSTPPLLVPLQSGDAYFLLDDFK